MVVRLYDRAREVQTNRGHSHSTARLVFRDQDNEMHCHLQSSYATV